MRYGSVCSGIEAATQAWHVLGWEPSFFSEIEAFPSAVLNHHYPSVPNLGDMTKFEEWPDHAIDLLVGGTPCQDYSVAGLRAGMDGIRGSLTITYAAIARRYRPRWLAWENVPGVFSLNGGRDFASFLGLLSGQRIEVPRDGWRNAGVIPGYHRAYGLAWRVLDAQYVRVDGFGRAVPQRRRRVFVVGYLGDWRRAAAVLFERYGLCGDSAPSRPAGQRAPENTSPCLTGGYGERAGQDLEKDGALIAFNPKMGGDPTMGLGVNADGTSYTLDHSGNANAIAFDTTQITSAANYSNPKPGDPCHPLASSAHPPAIAFDWYASQSQSLPIDEGACPPLKTTMQPAMAEGWAVRRLTPRECERLQGFPDDFTAIPYRNKVAADGPRYKSLGNSMAVNVMRWIGQRIQQVENLSEAA